MRLIDADKTLETLEGLTELVIGEGAALVKALTFAALKSESVVPTIGGWISVKDRLPEATEPDVNGEIAFSKMVLVCLAYEDGFSWITVDKCNIKQNAWLLEVPGDGCKVTHWMPLPEPPEGDDKK